MGIWFELAKVNHILGGRTIRTANGACVEGDRMIVGLRRMPAEQGQRRIRNRTSQWIDILEGTSGQRIGDQEDRGQAGSVIYIPSNAVHSG